MGVRVTSTLRPRTATYVIAASDAPTHVKAQADIVSDGVHDELDIKTVTDAIVANGVGKRTGKLVTIGNLIINDTIVLPNTLENFIWESFGKITLADLGIAKTYMLYGPFGGILGGGALFLNLRLDGDRTHNVVLASPGGQTAWAVGSYCTLVNCEVDNAPQVGLSFGLDCRVLGLNIISCGEHGIYGGCDGLIADGVYIYHPGSGTYAGDFRGYGIKLRSCHDSMIHNAHIIFPTHTTPNPDWEGVVVEDSQNIDVQAWVEKAKYGFNVEGATTDNVTLRLNLVGCSAVNFGSALAQNVRLVESTSDGGVLYLAHMGANPTIDGLVLSAGQIHIASADTAVRATLKNAQLSGSSNYVLDIRNALSLVIDNITVENTDASKEGVGEIRGISEFLEIKNSRWIGGKYFSVRLFNGGAVPTVGRLTGNDFNIPGAATPTAYGLGIDAAPGASKQLLIENNNIRGGYSNGLVRAGIVLKGNSGYVSENSGTATITAAATSVDVTHGLATTPTRVFVSPTLLSNSNKWWVTGIGTTKFTINVDVVPGASTATFDWHAQINEG